MTQSTGCIAWKTMMEHAADGFYAATGLDPETGEAYVILMDIGCIILNRARTIGAKMGQKFNPHRYAGYRYMIGSTPSEAECTSDDFPIETGLSLKAIYEELQKGRDPRKTVLVCRDRMKDIKTMELGRALRVKADLADVLPLRMGVEAPVGF